MNRIYAVKPVVLEWCGEFTRMFFFTMLAFTGIVSISLATVISKILTQVDKMYVSEGFIQIFGITLILLAALYARHFNKDKAGAS